MTTIGRWMSMGAPLLLTTAIAAQQVPVRDTVVAPSPTGTAVLSGTAVNDLTNAPLRRALVTLSSPDGIRVTAITNDSGAFSFTDLPASRYFLGATKPGYIGSIFGAKRPGRPGITIAVTAGQQLTNVGLRLQPGAVITGSVRNRNGEPVPGLRVIVLRSAFGSDTGERTLVPGNPGFGEVTDDRGMYRVFGLAPDDYLVVVSGGIGLRNATELRETTAAEMEWAARMLRPQNGAQAAVPAPPPAAGRAVDYAPVFYPGVSFQASASTISLKAGEERTGVDVLFEPIPTAKVTGTVMSQDGPVPTNLQVNVIAHDTIPGIPFSGFGTARVDKDGGFVSPGLAPGDYTITVRAPGTVGARGAGDAPAPSAALFGMTTVAVNGNDLDTVVRLESGVTVSGRIVFDPSASIPRPTSPRSV